ncbi:cortical protein KAR9-domain-containing protein [Aspergillus welwitschiae]|uniref:Cortical protein KAR9-domain-containing protein n=1 Tax=Aspergillus welwitschiae TaxID=1341132 RepID=A0A3F3QA77_9EURO|nr:cortical protein KAR9-domain-containing protein [Aspergillus welwitschiae]RDH36114.1 cortical protein KAR9-domain-containing protein [Aspergillus welwitschiae]
MAPVRASSPSPSIPATPAISSCPSPDRTFSTISSLSTSSATSADARSSVSISSKRRGYIRPQGVEFAESAKNRESVMSLGSIAHLQYYFARTGLLDGKGAQAREFKKKKKPEDMPRLLLTPNARFIDDLTTSPTSASPTDDESESIDPREEVYDEEVEVMLPPTVSTYSIKTHHIPPPPKLKALRKDLRDALEKAEHSIESMDAQRDPPAEMIPPRISLSSDDTPDTAEDPSRQEPAEATPQTWQEIQGMRVLDTVTFAIRAAKIYYTAHERPDRLAKIKSEREIRQELFNVLEVLKRWASRNFADGLREDERSGIVGWMANVRDMLAREAQLESFEAKERAAWIWTEGEWIGKERERETLFLRSLIGSDAQLPTWTAPEDGSPPPAMLERLRDGRDLVRAHNFAVKNSKRPFLDIKTYHQDVAKPYRRAENLRFWVKAAELRWETKLELDVMGIVHGNSEEAWKQFDQALLAWCKVVREELVRDWRERRASAASLPPDDLVSLGSYRPAPIPSWIASMRAMSTASTATTATTHPPDAGANLSTSQFFSPPPPPPPALSISHADQSRPRRIKSKSSLRSLRSLGSSSEPDDNQQQHDLGFDKTLVRPSILRRLSPGLAARVKLLDGSNKHNSPSRNPGAVGRIPEEQIKELDKSHQDLSKSIKIEKKGRSWNALPRLHKDKKSHESESGHLEELEEVPTPDSDRPLDLPSDQELEEAPLPDEVEEAEEEAVKVEAVGEEVIEEDAVAEQGVAEEVVAEDAVGVEATLEEPQTDMPAPEYDVPEQTDFEKYIQSTNDDDSNPPPPPPKDSPRPRSTTSLSSQSYFNPQGLQRTESIYSFSRASFSNQLSQLTSIPLPQPSSLEASISSIATAPAAIWVKKASDVLGGLDAEDDGVDKAIIRAIEEVQLREDIGDVSTDSLQTIVNRLRGVKGQVELAMEWEELWGNVLGDVTVEVEKKRHWTLAGEQDSSASGLDINELETIVEETPSQAQLLSSKRLSIDPILTGPPTMDMPVIQTPHDDTNHSNLIALFARIQPLRASLDFLPMRIACEELEERRGHLEQSFQKLEHDADALQKELNEDRWILVFRNAGGQAQKMFDSAIETCAHLHDATLFTKRIESYEAKKQHYVAAIERVVSIIRKEILRLLSDMTSRVDALKASVRVMDEWLEDINFVRSQHLRDSISSIMTMDSPLTGSVADTPGSSPASSVVMTPANPLKGSATPMGTSSRRGSSVSSAARTTMSKMRRKKSALPKPTLTAPSPSRMGAATPTPAARKPVKPAPSPIPNRPRWTNSTNTNDLYVGHVYKPNPTPRKASAPGRTSRPSSTIPMGPFRRDMSVSPAPMTARSMSRVSSRLTNRSPERMGSPTPNRTILDPPPYSKLRRPDGMSNAPRSRQSFAGLSFSRSVSHDHERNLASPTKTPRPGTALGHSANRRISLIPLPKNNPTPRSKLGERPPWR